MILFSTVVIILLSFKSSLYVLNSRLLSDTWFANIFYPEGCLYTFSSFGAWKFLSLMKSIFFVSYLCFGVMSKKLLPKPRLKRCTTIFLSMSFIGFPHKFRSYVHLELIFVYPIFLLIFFEIRYWSHYSFWISLFKIHYWSLQLLWPNCLFLLSVQLVFASCILVLCCQGHMVL